MATKRLYKSQKRMLMGVCGGVADYLGLDPTIIRLVWVLVTFFSAGVGIIAYIVCAVIMPDRPSSEEGWENMKRANDYTEQDKEFDSYFAKERKQKGK